MNTYPVLKCDLTDAIELFKLTGPQKKHTGSPNEIFIESTSSSISSSLRRCFFLRCTLPFTKIWAQLAFEINFFSVRSHGYTQPSHSVSKT